MSIDPWAAAAAPVSTPQSDGNVADMYAPQTASPVGDESQLFGGVTLAPSLFNKNHKVGEKLTGIITDAPFDVHSKDMATKELKYWTEDGKVVKGGTGAGLRPVLDTVLPLATEYRFTPAELTERDRGEDDGERAFYAAAGEALRALRAAIKRAGVKSGAEMIGMRFTAARVGQRPSKVGGSPAWLWHAELTRD